MIAFATDSRLPEATRERYPGTPAQWDRLSRRAGVVAGREQWRERLDGPPRAPARALRGRPPAVAARAPGRDRRACSSSSSDLGHVIDDRPADAPWSEHVDHLAQTFDTYLRDHGPILASVRALARLDRLTPTVSGERFIAVVRSVVGGLRDTETASGRAGAFRARGINVLDVNSLRQLRFRAVCVLGLAERSFPPAPRQDPLLLDDERAQLGLPQRAHGADPEPLQFALAVQAAGERLLLSHPRTEHGSGRPLIASSFLRGAAEALAGERIPAEDLPDHQEPWLRAAGRRPRRRPGRCRRRSTWPSTTARCWRPTRRWGWAALLAPAAQRRPRPRGLAGPPDRAKAHALRGRAHGGRPGRPCRAIRA